MSLRRIPPEVLRFLAAGSLAAGLNWLVRFPLSMALPFSAAVALSYAIGMTAGFLLYRRWVFAGSSISPVAQFMRFAAVNAVTALIVLAVAMALATSLQQMGVPMQWAEACGHATAIAIGASINFFGHKFVSFAGRALA
jgi:energy-coupling factor transport system substrate-specific component